MASYLTQTICIWQSQNCFDAVYVALDGLQKETRFLEFYMKVSQASSSNIMNLQTNS